MYVTGSFFKWFWLARSISGRSHAVKIIKGEERGSEMKMFCKVSLFSFVVVLSFSLIPFPP